MKTFRVGPLFLGLVGLPETHNFFHLAYKKKFAKCQKGTVSMYGILMKSLFITFSHPLLIIYKINQLHHKNRLRPGNVTTQ